MIESKSNLHLFFSTPVWKSQLNNFEELNNKLYNYITDLEKTDPKGLSKSTIGGWHSPNFDLKHEKPRLFVNAINPGLTEAFKRFRLECKKPTSKNYWNVVNNK